MTVKGLEKWGDKVRECPLSNGNTIYFVNYEGLDFDGNGNVTVRATLVSVKG